MSLREARKAKEEARLRPPVGDALPDIPTHYCNGYLGDIGISRSDAPMKFSAGFEAYSKVVGTRSMRVTTCRASDAW
ncbi:MAG TPA: hypothetical protein VFW47_09405 [Phenylobacterium sp.]|nr:hypothetical protein [Phenylobacterium sp.]